MTAFNFTAFLSLGFVIAWVFNSGNQNRSQLKRAAQSTIASAVAGLLQLFSRRVLRPSLLNGAVSIMCTLLFLGVLERPAVAQTSDTGFPPFGTFQNGSLDSVNLQNLNAAFEIPILSHAGRGLNFRFGLTYNSRVFRITKSPAGSNTWSLRDGWSTDGPTGSITSQNVSWPCFQQPSLLGIGNFFFVDPSGTAHPFPVQKFPLNSCGATTILSGYALDASGYFLDITGPTIVRAPDGTKFDMTKTSNTDANGNLISTLNPTITDPNGNTITSTTYYQTNGIPNGGETDWTDTLGQIVLKAVSVNNGPSGTRSEMDYKRLAVDGSYQTIAVKFQFVSVQTTFGCTGVNEAAASNASLVSEIDLPNGQRYLFAYEPTPGNPSAVTGRIQTITLPTGGTLNYQYTGANGGINCTDGSVLGLTRTISDGVNPSTWIYTRVTSGGPAGTTTITAPQLPYDSTGSQTVVTFDSRGREVNRATYQGRSSGTPLLTLVTAWAANNTPASKTATMEDGSTQSQIETIYDSNGNLQTMREHDLGSGTPGPVLRTTSVQYLSSSAYTGLNITNKVTSKTVADSSGTVKYRLTVNYDEPGYVNALCITGAAQHDDTYGCSYTTRGLATSFVTYSDAATPSGGVTKHFTYDSFGNLIAADLSCCNQKTWTFSATTQYAFPDSVVTGSTGGPQLTTSATYYLKTGQIRTSTDENGQVTTYTYSDPGHLDRLTDVQRPDLVHLTHTYDDLHLSTTSSQPIQGANAIHEVTAFDGLGRPLTRTTEDANGTVTSAIQSQYDALGRPYMVSNPFTTAPQFWTTRRFDALNRPTITILPDGAQTTSTYSANVSLVSDPSGKQRKAIMNGLGQLVEIDEPGTVPASANYHATMQTDGNFVLSDSSNRALWSTGTSGTGAQNIFIQDDGNLVLYIFKWQAGVYAAPNPGPFPKQACSIGTYLIVGGRINANQCLVSPHGQYILYMDPNGNFYIYDIAHGKGTWGANTAGHPGAYAILQTDGNFVVYDANNKLLWNSGTSGTFSERLNMEDDGRIIIYKSAWNSGTSTGQFSTTQLPHPTCDVGTGTGAGGVLGSGQCFVSPNGHFKFVMQNDGNLALWDISVTPTQLTWLTQTTLTSLSPGIALITRYSYGVLDNLLQVSQGAQTRSYVFDGMGRMTDATTPEAGHINYQYNTLNLVTLRTDARGVITTYGYDNLNRLKSASYNVGTTGVAATSSITYQYGTDPAQNDNGRLVTMLDGLGSETYSYDQLGRINNAQKVINGITYKMGYSYDLVGDVTAITYPSGRVVQQSYDTVGRLCEIAPQTSGCGSSSAPFATGYSYNAADELTAFAYGNGVNASFGYSPDRLQLNRVSYQKSGQQLFGLNYYYQSNSALCPNGSSANNGQIQCIADTVDSGRGVSYAYDNVGRLATAVTVGSVNYPQTSLSFTYDRYGNRIAQNASNTATDPTTNRVTTLPYDASGNMLNDGLNQLSYDAESRLVTSTVQSAISSYAYDCKGLRVVKTSGGSTTTSIYSGGKVIAEYTNGADPSAPAREYIYSGSRLLAKIEVGTTNYYHADHLSTRVTSDASGSVAGQQGQLPFGDPWYDVGKTPTRKFTEYARDLESQNDYALARHYVNRFGRFSSADPMNGSILNPQTMNRYSYAGNDPINNTDPTGAFLLAFDLFLDPAGFPDADLMSFGIFINHFCTSVDGGPDVCEENITFIDPVMSPGGPDPITLATNKVLGILKGKNPCADWFNAGTLQFTMGGASPWDPAANQLANTSIIKDKDGPSTITKNVPPRGEITYSQPYGAKTVQGGANSGAPIEINPNGAFYRSSAVVQGTVPLQTMPLTIGGTANPQQYGGDTLAAQITIILHELAHQVELIPPDGKGSSKGQSTKNTQTVLDHCKDAIDAAAKSK